LGMDSEPASTQPGALGSAVNSPSCVRGGVSAAQRFSYILSVLCGFSASLSNILRTWLSLKVAGSIAARFAGNIHWAETRFAGYFDVATGREAPRWVGWTSVAQLFLTLYICSNDNHFLFMAALRSRCRHYIFALWFLSSIFFIPRLISAVRGWMFTILPHMAWP